MFSILQLEFSDIFQSLTNCIKKAPFKAHEKTKTAKKGLLRPMHQRRKLGELIQYNLLLKLYAYFALLSIFSALHHIDKSGS